MGKKQEGPTKVVGYTCRGCTYLADHKAYGFYARMCKEPSMVTDDHVQGSPLWLDEPTQAWCPFLSEGKEVQ
jgi:hypothetical protein